MRIAMILEAPLFFGGGEIHAYELSKNLVRLGHDVDFIQMHGTPRKRTLRKNEVLGPSRWIAPPVSRYLSAFYARGLWSYSYLAFPFMYREMMKGKYNILHIHGFGCASPLMAAVLTRRSNHCKIVCTLHNDLARHIDRKLIRMAVPRVSAFIAVSRLIQSKWLMSYGRQPFFIPNGVDSFRFNPNVNGSQMRRKLGVQDKFVVLSIGRLSYQKGLEYLIQAISQIQKENENMVVLICGRGEKESYLKKLTRDLGLEGIVKFLGFIPSEQLPELYAACDVFVIPSIFETFPLALLEALSVGKPVIASNVGGAREIAHELKTICGATIVQPKNPSHIAKAISWYFDHKDVGNSARHVLARREYIIRNFSWEKIAEQTLDLYNAIE